MERWATFDCYGTLIDWNGGIRAELARVFGDDARPTTLLARYHELEPELQRDGTLSYREVMTEAMRRLGAPAGDGARARRSLPGWRPFPEVRGALEELRRRGWKLAILSNSDPDLIAASKELIGVPFDETVVASEIGSYKPAHRHWEEFFARTLAPRAGHVHVGASALPRHRAGERARAARASGSTASASLRRCSRRASCPTCSRCRRRSTSSVPV